MIEVLMPALSPTMTEGKISSWIKKEGETVEPGEVIAEIETDKAVMEVEAADSGVLGKILVPDGTSGVKVNSVIAVLLEDGETDASSYTPSESEDKPAEVPAPAAPAPVAPAPVVATPVVAAPVVQEAPKPVSSSNSGDRVFASPLAKRIADEKNFNLSEITGTGPNGRIVKADVLGFNGSASKVIVRKPDSMLPCSDMRKVIAARLLESKTTVPHFYLSLSVCIDNLLSIREQINSSASKDENGKPEFKVSVNDFIIKASGAALKDFPAVNSSWTNDGILQYGNVDVSIAVSIPDGLITPIIRNADQKGIIKISSEMKDLAKRARSSGLKLEEFQGGGFSISNLGMFGIESFSAIINPPQSAILAVGCDVVKVGEDGKSRKYVNLTLSCDHRIVDGVLGAEFLGRVKHYLEKPALLIM